MPHRLPPPHLPAPHPPAPHLLAAAEELFAECGYRRTTVAQVCARAGIATGSFYAHFSSKQEVHAAVVRRIGADLESALRSAIEEAGQLHLDPGRACLCACLDVFRKRPGSDRIVREAEFVDPGLFREHHELLVRWYARGVRQAQASGAADARVDPEVIATIYAGIGHFAGIRWAADTGVPDDMLEEMLSLLARLPARA